MSTSNQSPGRIRDADLPDGVIDAILGRGPTPFRITPGVVYTFTESEASDFARGITPEMRAADPYPEGATAGELAAMLEMSVRRVQQLAECGALIRRSRGDYDALASVMAYCRFLREGGHPVYGLPCIEWDFPEITIEEIEAFCGKTRR